METYWCTCPACGALGVIDEEQKQGKVSIICSECSWHGYASECHIEKR